MDTSKIRRFAQFARSTLIEQVGVKLEQVLKQGSLARRENEKGVADLEKLIDEIGEEQVIERVAYTWFNRFVSLRYMDVNRYTRIGIVSPPKDQIQPEILGEAKMGHIDETLVPESVRIQVLNILDGTTTSSDPQGEAYRLLLVAACNYYHKLMPFMFERIADYTELLLPDDLLSGNSILTYTREALLPANCSPELTDESVEVIGWLYQFYISEKKDDVFAALKKGKKITPENIPAATQLFTPHWIVRYLVENSLGRLWMLNHPDSRLVEQMDYYIKPEEPETDFLRIGSPEEIKICDPACGSGHMLTYAFDLLYAIYEEQGYQATDIPRLILENNLFGVEIDQRAGALAAFALTMKAREKYRRFLTGGKVVQPNICVLENISIDPEDLSAYMDKIGRDLFSDGLQGVVNQWQEANNFGSLIRPMVTDVGEVLELLRERQMGEDLFLAGVHQKVLNALRQADYLSPKYHVVVANPPYMGGKGMNSSIKDFARKHYKESKADLFSMFIDRNLTLALNTGSVAMITMQSWMFLKSYEDLRDEILNRHSIVTLVHLGPNAFDTIGGEVVSTSSFVITRNQSDDRVGQYVDATKGQNEAEKLRVFMDSKHDPFNVRPSEFMQIPGAPISYWVVPEIRQLYLQPLVGSKFDAREGVGTRNDDVFMKMTWEVSLNNIGRDRRWIITDKAGENRKWYTDLEYLMDWENDGYRIKNYRNEDGSLRSRPQNTQFLFREGVSWSKVGTERPAFRFRPEGFGFNDAAPTAFGGDSKALIAQLNSSVTSRLLKIRGQTMNTTVGIIEELPLLVGNEFVVNTSLHPLVDRAIEITAIDAANAETSYNFTSPPLIQHGGQTLAIAYSKIHDQSKDLIRELMQIENEINEVFVSAYDLGKAIEDTEICVGEVSLDCNPVYRYGLNKSDSDLDAFLLEDTMKEFVSYAVGCMLGRYSLNKPGLILANQGETADDYRQQVPDPTFAPDEDNVIPILASDDDHWFEDDITERFKKFLKVTFGEDNFEQNLTFLEDALYPDNANNKKRKDIRNYFVKDFYDHHWKMYKKRPIYWLFTSKHSGSGGAFNALIYMHRYREDTVSVILNDYLRELIGKMNAEIESKQHLADSADASKTEKTRAIKRVNQLKKDVKELEEYEREILRPLAQKQVPIDLDDGVKVNYNKFGKALKKVTGLTGKA